MDGHDCVLRRGVQRYRSISGEKGWDFGAVTRPSEARGSPTGENEISGGGFVVRKEAELLIGVASSMKQGLPRHQKGDQILRKDAEEYGDLGRIKERGINVQSIVKEEVTQKRGVRK